MAASPELSDAPAEAGLAELVAAIHAGSAAAEARLMSRFALGVRVLMRRHAGGAPVQVDDLAQDVLGAVLEQLRKGAVRDAVALPAYIRTSAMHRLHAELRAVQGAAQSHESLDGDDPRLVAAARAPADEIDAARKARLVRELLAQLPVQRDREVLRRFYFEEETCEDICAALDIEPDHFRRVIHRARARFRDILNQAGIGPERE
jgi:RNA polymerase sigma-70 factor (ECF subfamily)